MTQKKIPEIQGTGAKQGKEARKKRTSMCAVVGEKGEENLENLRIIESYLNRTIDEHQKILSSHFDLKALYTRELEALSQMSLIRRFSMRNDFYDKVLENPSALGNLDYFLRPLFNREPDKVYNLNKALLYQKPSVRMRTRTLRRCWILTKMHI